MDGEQYGRKREFVVAYGSGASHAAALGVALRGESGHAVMVVVLTLGHQYALLFPAEPLLLNEDPLVSAPIASPLAEY